MDSGKSDPQEVSDPKSPSSPTAEAPAKIKNPDRNQSVAWSLDNPKPASDPQNKTSDPSVQVKKESVAPAGNAQTGVHPQDKNTEPFIAPAPMTEQDSPRKQLSFLQNYTPSSLLNWGQFEVKAFNNMYTQTQYFSGRKAVSQGNRSTFYSMINSITLGINSRINAGIDIWLQSVRYDDSSSSPFSVLKFENAPSDDYNVLPRARTAVSYIGPKIKVQPFKNIGRFSFQSSLLIPVAKNPEGATYLASSNTLWWTQFFSTKNFADDRLQLFAEADLHWSIDKELDSAASALSTPISYFLSWFPTSKITIYQNAQFWPTWGGETGIRGYFFQTGLGVKYQIASFLDMELSGSKFLFGQNAAGPGTVLNFGLRYVKF